MKSMKDDVAEVEAKIDEIKESSVEMTAMMEERVRIHRCPFCGSKRLMKRIGYETPFVIEHTHCSKCKENWIIFKNSEVLMYKTKEYWLDKDLRELTAKKPHQGESENE